MLHGDNVNIISYNSPKPQWILEISIGASAGHFGTRPNPTPNAAKFSASARETLVPLTRFSKLALRLRQN